MSAARNTGQRRQLTALGVLIVLQHTLTKTELETWGWRIPFFIGAALAVVVFWIQFGLEARRGLTGSGIAPMWHCRK